MCAKRRRIPASASANQGPEKGDLVQGVGVRWIRADHCSTHPSLSEATTGYEPFEH